MKKLSTVIIVSLFAFSLKAQDFEIIFNAKVGATIVDVAEAMGYELEDWNTVCYGGLVQGFYHYTDQLSFGGELGYQRLYYYEYWYAYGGYWQWGDIGTFHIGPSLQYSGNQFFSQAGLHLHVFRDGSVPGLMFGGGYKIPITDHFSIPIGLRGDLIFGDATPFAVTLNIGLSFIP